MRAYWMQILKEVGIYLILKIMEYEYFYKQVFGSRKLLLR